MEHGPGPRDRRHYLPRIRREAACHEAGTRRPAATRRPRYSCLPRRDNAMGGAILRPPCHPFRARPAHRGRGCRRTPGRGSPGTGTSAIPGSAHPAAARPPEGPRPGLPWSELDPFLRQDKHPRASLDPDGPSRPAAGSGAPVPPGSRPGSVIELSEEDLTAITIVEQHAPGLQRRPHGRPRAGEKRGPVGGAAAQGAERRVQAPVLTARRQLEGRGVRADRPGRRAPPARGPASRRVGACPGQPS